MNQKSHLPLFGAGPAYVIVISILTVAALILHCRGYIPGTEMSKLSSVCLKTASVLLICSGIMIWCGAVLSSRLRKNIRENRLVTTGMYGIVRHPVYSAFTLAEWGILLWTCNMWLLILIPVYWTYFTILIRNTEEKWLHEFYGEEYAEYCRRVNRCIPWFPRKK